MYYSQYNQDKFINNILLKDVKDGFFLDIGAHDGISFSNTYFFEKNKNFSGICFEPNPIVFNKLKKNRTSKCLNLCVSNTSMKLKFLCVDGYGEMLSGIFDAMDQRHLERINDSIQKYGGSKKIIEVEAINLNEIPELKERKIDYCNIDTEGSELQILQSIDFDNIMINIFSIENNFKTNDVNAFLVSKGYTLLGTVGDDIYVKNNLLTIKILLKSKFYFLRQNLIFFMKKHLFTSRNV